MVAGALSYLFGNSWKVLSEGLCRLTVCSIAQWGTTISCWRLHRIIILFYPHERLLFFLLSGWARVGWSEEMIAAGIVLGWARG